MSGFQPGDLLIFDRGLFEHWAVYIGNNRVIHFTADAYIVEEDYRAVKGDSSVKVERKPSPYSGKEIVARAKKMKTKKTWSKYDKFTNNCEHFAMWCRYNEAESEQGDAGMVIAVVGALVGIPVAGALAVQSSQSTSTAFQRR